MTPSYPTATRTRSQGMVFLFRWPCYQIQADTPVDVWSNHACQVAFSQHCLLWWVCQHSFFPGLRKCTPRQRYVNQQAASWSKVGSSRSVPMVLLSLDFGQEMHPTSRKGQSPSCWTFMFTEGHVQRVPGYGGEDLQNDTKSKDKGKRPNQGRIAKRIPSRGDSPNSSRSPS